MTKKTKVVVLDSVPPYGVGVSDDAKARLKHQTLMRDYEDLQKVYHHFLWALVFKDLVLYLIFFFLLSGFCS